MIGLELSLRESMERTFEIAKKEALSGRRYLDDLCRLSCAGDLMALGFFPNAKEITESFAAHHAVVKHLRKSHSLNDPRVALVAVGDGTRPRTAATFVFRSHWECWSVDPALRSGDAGRRLRRKDVRRMHVLAQRAEDTVIELGDRPAVIACVHSHAPLAAARATVRTTGQVAVIAMPCCVKQELDRPPDVEYADFGIMSPMRLMRIWRDA